MGQHKWTALSVAGLLTAAACVNEPSPLPPGSSGEAPGGNQTPGPPPSDGGSAVATDGGLVSTTEDALRTFALSHAHRAWAAEPAVHPSAGPHGVVRTYVNATLLTSLRSGDPSHPAGSVAVKELFNAAGTEVTGYAVVAKDSPSGEWVFYEGFTPDYDDYYFRGTTNFCAGCHQTGTDYIWTPASAFP